MRIPLSPLVSSVQTQRGAHRSVRAHLTPRSERSLILRSRLVRKLSALAVAAASPESGKRKKNEKRWILREASYEINSCARRLVSIVNTLPATTCSGEYAAIRNTLPAAHRHSTIRL